MIHSLPSTWEVIDIMDITRVFDADEMWVPYLLVLSFPKEVISWDLWATCRATASLSRRVEQKDMLRAVERCRGLECRTVQLVPCWKIWLFGVGRGLMLPSHRYHRFDMRIKYHQPFWGSGLLNQSVQWNQFFDWMAVSFPILQSFLQSVIWSQFPHSDTGIPVPGNLCKNVFPVVWLGRWSFLFDVRLWLGGWPGSSSPPKRWYNLKKTSSSSDSSDVFFFHIRLNLELSYRWSYEKTTPISSQFFPIGKL